MMRKGCDWECKKSEVDRSEGEGRRQLANFPSRDPHSPCDIHKEVIWFPQDLLPLNHALESAEKNRNYLYNGFFNWSDVIVAIYERHYEVPPCEWSSSSFQRGSALSLSQIIIFFASVAPVVCDHFCLVAPIMRTLFPAPKSELLYVSIIKCDFLGNKLSLKFDNTSSPFWVIHKSLQLRRNYLNVFCHSIEIQQSPYIFNTLLHKPPLKKTTKFNPHY